MRSLAEPGLPMSGGGRNCIGKPAPVERRCANGACTIQDISGRQHADRGCPSAGLRRRAVTLPDGSGRLPIVCNRPVAAPPTNRPRVIGRIADALKPKIRWLSAAGLASAGRALVAKRPPLHQLAPNLTFRGDVASEVQGARADRGPDRDGTGDGRNDPQSQERRDGRHGPAISRRRNFRLPASLPLAGLRCSGRTARDQPLDDGGKVSPCFRRG